MIDGARLDGDILSVRIPMRLERHGGRKLIVAPEGTTTSVRKPERDETLIRAIVKAHRWRRRIESGKAKSITDLAAQENVSDAYVCRLLPLTCLAPDIVEAIFDGRQPRTLKLIDLLQDVPLHWPHNSCSNEAHPVKRNPMAEHGIRIARVPSST